MILFIHFFRLTVKEILKFNADARLAVTTTREEKENLINDIIEVLGLYHVKYNIIGDVEQRGLSGGERKRVNIGMELAADPNGKHTSFSFTFFSLYPYIENDTPQSCHSIFEFEMTVEVIILYHISVIFGRTHKWIR
jgi:hypothetical protein